MTDLQQLRARLEPFEQTHVLRFWDELSPPRRLRLTDQIESLDLAQIDLAYGESGAEHWHEMSRRAVSPPAVGLIDPARVYSLSTRGMPPPP